MGSIFKKQCKYLPSALAEAQSKCVFFYLLTEMFLIDFTIGLMPILPKNDRFDFNMSSLFKTLDIKLMENQFQFLWSERLNQMLQMTESIDKNDGDRCKVLLAMNLIWKGGYMRASICLLHSASQSGTYCIFRVRSC